MTVQTDASRQKTCLLLFWHGHGHQVLCWLVKLVTGTYFFLTFQGVLLSEFWVGCGKDFSEKSVNPPSILRSLNGLFLKVPANVILHSELLSLQMTIQSYRVNKSKAWSGEERAHTTICERELVCMKPPSLECKYARLQCRLNRKSSSCMIESQSLLTQLKHTQSVERPDFSIVKLTECINIHSVWMLSHCS